MAKELNEDTGFKISVKTLIAIAVGITTVVSFWFAFQSDLDVMRYDIEEAKENGEKIKVQSCLDGLRNDWS